MFCHPATSRRFTLVSGTGGTGGDPRLLTCPAKALLSDLAEVTGLPSGLHVYRAYLKCSFNLNLSHDTLAGLEDSTLARFYNQDDPTQPPRYLEWTETRHWARLELALGVRLVLARPPDAFGRPWTRVHDHRSTDLLLPPSSSSSRTALFYAVTREDNRWVLYRGSGEADFELTRFAESFVVDWKRLADTGRISKSSDCYFRKFSDALGRTPWNASAHPVCDDTCSTLYGVCSETVSAAFEATPFTLATHVSTRLTVKRSQLPRHQLYQKLGRFGGGGGKDVLLLRIDGSVVPVKEEHARQVLAPEAGSGGSSEHPSHYSHPGLAAFKRRAAKARKRRWRTEGEPAPHCAACDEEEDYRKNLDPRKGQKLYNYQPSTFHLLQMLGMDSPENVAAIRRAADLSCLYYDVESCTIMSKTAAGREELHLNFQPLTEHGEGRKVLATQRPVLISLADGIDLEAEASAAAAVEEWEPAVLSCEPGAVDDMVARFVDLVVLRRDRATAAKEEILRPLVSGVATFKEAYLNFFRSEGVLPPALPERPKLSVPAAAALDDFEDSCQQDERFRQDFGGDVCVEEEAPPPPPPKRSGRRRRKEEEEEEEDPSVTRTVRDVHKGWSTSVWGRLEGNLATLTKSFSAFGFNCEG
jgi:hypothetical protein